MDTTVVVMSQPDICCAGFGWDSSWPQYEGRTYLYMSERKEEG